MQRRSFLALTAASAAAALAPLPLARASVWRLRPWRLDLVNAHTGESFTGPYRDDKGPIADAIEELCFFLRDFHCGEKTEIDVGILDFLAAVIDAVGATRATVLSAYRTPATNAILARTTFGVAEHSQHIYGRALDIYLPARLEDAMQAARAMQRGGVGWYPNSGFIHIDTGPVRNWRLDGSGFGRLLLGPGTTPWFHEPISISPKGELLVGRSERPATIADRLAINRLLARAVGLPGAH
jgi:uncharacterized protein YcbK (DUF882 family)